MDTTNLIDRLEALDEWLNGDDDPSLIHIVNGLLEVVSDLCYGLKEEATDDYELERLAARTNPFFGGVKWALTKGRARHEDATNIKP